MKLKQKKNKITWDKKLITVTYTLSSVCFWNSAVGSSCSQAENTDMQGCGSPL